MNKTIFMIAISVISLNVSNFGSIVVAQEDEAIGIPIDALDLNADGIVEPFEAADAIQRINDDAESKKGLSISEMEKQFTEWEGEGVTDVVKEFDKNADSKIQKSELPQELHVLFDDANKDGDDSLNESETITLLFAMDDQAIVEERLLDESSVRDVVKEVYREYDKDKNGKVSRDEWKEIEDIDQEFESDFLIADRDGDALIDFKELEFYLLAVEGPVRFEVKGDQAFMSGVIGPELPGAVMKLIVEHPDVRTIVMQIVPGSLDDDSNIRGAELIRKHRFTTIVDKHGWIASGGVDFFLAGVKREARQGAKFGIHAWEGEDGSGADEPKDSEEHKLFLEFYNRIGIAESFYWYTLKAAPPEEIHWMTNDELEKFGFITKAKK